MAADGGSIGLKPEARTADPLVEERRQDRIPPAKALPKAAGRHRRRLRWALFLLLPMVRGMYLPASTTGF